MSSSAAHRDELELVRHDSPVIKGSSYRTRSQTRNRDVQAIPHSRESLAESTLHQSSPISTDACEESSHDSISDEDLDRYPFSYFLTPIDDEDDQMLERVHLSAGIEEISQCEPVIRTTSASSLTQANSPPSLCSSAMTSDTSDSEEDNDAYQYFIPQDVDVPVSFQDLTTAFEKRQVRYKSISTSALSSGLRARGVLKHTPRGRSNSRYGPRRHSWREPSPDVWSIAEEDETAERPMFERKRNTKRVHFELGG